MTASTATDFFAKTAERRIAPINGLEQWGLTFCMRSMTAREKDEFEASVLNDDLTKVDDERLKTAKARLVVECVCDDKGTLLFGTKDVERVRDSDSKALEIIHSQIDSHVGFNRGDLEKLVKNSGAVRAASSPSS